MKTIEIKTKSVSGKLYVELERNYNDNLILKLFTDPADPKRSHITIKDKKYRIEMSITRCKKERVWSAIKKEYIYLPATQQKIVYDYNTHNQNTCRSATSAFLFREILSIVTPLFKDEELLLETTSAALKKRIEHWEKDIVSEKKRLSV